MPASRRQLDALEADYQLWRTALFEPYLTDSLGRIVPDAPYHRAYWLWLWAIERGTRPRPFVGIWPRGGAKSTNAEMGAIALGARRRRRYGWYISATQDQADDHVGNIADMLESREVATWYPALAERRVGKYGSSKGWRRNRLRTRSGFTIDAVGLDTNARGIKIEEDRPDFMVIDDVDHEHDGPDLVAKKLRLITRTLIPAGAEDLAVLAIQNLIHPGSIFTQLASADPPFLTNRIVSGPTPAIADLTYEARPDGGYEITGGEATWIGLDLDRCQGLLDDIGITAFLSELQHEVEAPAGGMFDHLDLAALRTRPDAVPPLTRVVCWVDPAVTKTDASDHQAIQIDGIDGGGRDGTIYRLFSWEERSTPLATITLAITEAARFHAEKVGIETDQGGDTWRSVFREAKQAAIDAAAGDPDLQARIRRMRYDEAKAGQGQEPKAERASRMLADYERPGRRIRHVLGTHRTLERALRRFPRTKPLDLVDASYWAWDDLRNGAVIAGYNPDAAARAGTDRDGTPVDDPYAAPRRSSLWT